jgi:hypothetical protein
MTNSNLSGKPGLVQDMLGDVLAELRTIPVKSPICASGIKDFDARVNWAGARLEDILATLNWALD